MSAPKILILSSSIIFPKNLFYEENIIIHEYFRTERNFLIRVLRKLTIGIGYFRRQFWLKHWFGSVKHSDLIILIAVIGISDVISDLQKGYKNKKIIIFFWDPVYRVSECLLNDYEKWSFDINDCMHFQLKFNSTFYFRKLINQSLIPELPVLYDIYFLGRNKGRKHEIDNWIGQLSHFNFTNKILIIPDKDDTLKRYHLTFQENIKNVIQSKAILDIYQDGQVGLSLRVMESIYFKKKLITNNRSLVDEIFYNKSNVFILGYDDLSVIDFFLFSDYDTNNWDYLIEYYNFNSWINRFITI